MPPPTISSTGSAIDHSVNADGSVDISFEWAWTGSNASIDGFEVRLRSSNSGVSYTMGTTVSGERVENVPAGKRVIYFYGMAANKYYTFSVRAFRVVDPDVNAARVIYSSIVQPALASEDPYQPSTSVSLGANVVDTGAIAAGAATDLYWTTPASPYTVTEVAHDPNGYAWNNNVMTITFTAAGTGRAQVMVDARAAYTTTAAGTGYCSYSIQSTGAAFDPEKELVDRVPASTADDFSVHATRSFAVVGGTSYTFAFCANKFRTTDTLVFDRMEMRVEVVKR